MIKPLLPENAVHVNATCRIQGQNAVIAGSHWPAQLQACGAPAGSANCGGNTFDPALPVVFPYRVHYTGGEYWASYSFSMKPAWLNNQDITHRYFLCLYNDTAGTVVQKSGASIDVYAPPPPPPPNPPPQPPQPPPPPPPPAPPPLVVFKPPAPPQAPAPAPGLGPSPVPAPAPAPGLMPVPAPGNVLPAPVPAPGPAPRPAQGPTPSAGPNLAAAPSPGLAPSAAPSPAPAPAVLPPPPPPPPAAPRCVAVASSGSTTASLEFDPPSDAVLCAALLLPGDIVVSTDALSPMALFNVTGLQVNTTYSVVAQCKVASGALTQISDPSGCTFTTPP